MLPNRIQIKCFGPRLCASTICYSYKSTNSISQTPLPAFFFFFSILYCFRRWNFADYFWLRAKYVIYVSILCNVWSMLVLCFICTMEIISRSPHSISQSRVIGIAHYRIYMLEMCANKTTESRWGPFFFSKWVIAVCFNTFMQWVRVQDELRVLLLSFFAVQIKNKKTLDKTNAQTNSIISKKQNKFSQI